MARRSTLLVAIVLLVNGIFCALPAPPSTFVATVQTQSWDFTSSTATIYARSGVGYRMDLPMFESAFFFDIENQVLAVMSQKDYSCTINPWPQPGDFWSFITPENSMLVTKMDANVSFWQFSKGFSSPNEGWLFDGNTPVSGTSFASMLWSVTSFNQQNVPKEWLHLPCTKSTYTYTDNVVKNPLLRRK